jgi:sugar O-acyltransferase (sialic acid O-acetyltransferase NeuD family)
MDKIILIGGDGYAAEVSIYLKDNKALTFEVYDDNEEIHPSLQELRVGNIEDFIENFDGTRKCFLAIGDALLKKEIHNRIKHLSINYYSFIHPTATISSTAKLGECHFLYPYSIVANNAAIGDFVTLNSYSAIGHDSIIGNYSVLSAHVDITGHVEIGECVFFGSGSRAMPKLKIGSGTRVGAGVTVVKNSKPKSLFFPGISKNINKSR